MGGVTRKAPPARPARDLPGRLARPGCIGEGLSPDEAREASQNLAAFFRLLDAWDRGGAALKPAAAPPAASTMGTVRTNAKVAVKAAAKVARRDAQARGRTR